MARIALLRGHHLSKEETLSYEALRDEHEFTCITSTAPWFDHSDIVFPILRLPCSEALAKPLPGGLGRQGFGFVDMHLGTGQWLYGLGRILRGFDIVFTSDYCHLFTYQAARLRRRIGFKLVTMHYENIPFARERYPLVRWTKPSIVRATDCFFAMSERSRAALELEGIEPSRIQVIGNVVDTETFRPRTEERRALRSRFGLHDDDLVVLFVGRIHESKGVFPLIHAFKRLVTDPAVDARRLRLLLAGRGNREGEVREKIARLDLNNHVTLLGGIPHSRVHEVYPVADIFTLPSIPIRDWQEQFGIVLLEAMACGLPVVSTLSGSIEEVVGSAGVLVQPADHTALAHALKGLILDSHKREALGIRARERALSTFSKEVGSRRIREAFARVQNL